jgi:hypothetical protein
MKFFARLFAGREILAKEVEELLVEHFAAYWAVHPPTTQQRDRVITLIQERICMASDEVLRELLDTRISLLKTAGILDKVVESAYGGNSTLFLRLLAL